MDGEIGLRTRNALQQCNIDVEDLDEQLLRIEDLLQEKFPGEFTIRVLSDEKLFDFETPGHVDQ